MTGTECVPIMHWLSLPMSVQIGRNPAARQCSSIVSTKPSSLSVAISVLSGW
ncbi:MAG: hypothetical protein J6T51_07410 [Kiritimatiellae bacterium]|nr:hypothetical protein [Kiritimatiellia bacterium]